MAPLPVNNTNRFLWKYSDGVHEHVQLWRFPEAVVVGPVMEVVHDFWTAIAADLYLITFVSASAIAINDNVALPVTWTGDATYGGGTMPAVNAPRELRWEGYSTGGRKVSYAVWGGEFSTPATYRLQVDAVPNYDAGTAVLRAAQAAGTICAIDGQPANIKSYINVNFNSYWEEQARG